MTSINVDRRTGAIVRDRADIRQSVEDILTTRIGSRLLARDYGSDVPSRVDAPMNDRNRLALFADIHDALQPRQGMYGILGEPRFALRRIVVTDASVAGRIVLLLLGVEYPNGHKGDMTPANGAALVELAIDFTRFA